MKKRMTRTARMLSKGGTAGGPKPKPKGMMAGGVPPKPKPKGMRAGGKSEDKLKMVTDPETGKKVPFFTVDGEGKMKGGGTVPNSKGYFKGGKTLNEGGRVRGSTVKSRKRKPRGRSLLEQKMDVASFRANYPGKKPPEA